MVDGRFPGRYSDFDQTVRGVTSLWFRVEDEGFGFATMLNENSSCTCYWCSWEVKVESSVATLRMPGVRSETTRVSQTSVHMLLHVSSVCADIAVDMVRGQPCP